MPPDPAAALAALRCWRRFSLIEAAISAIPSMWAAIWRTSQAGQSVGMAHWAGVRDRNISAQRSYSAAARRMATGRGRADSRGFIVVPFLGQTKIVCEHGDHPGDQAAPPLAARVVGELLVDQAAEERGVDVGVLVPGDADAAQLLEHEVVDLHGRRVSLGAGLEVRDDVDVHQLGSWQAGSWEAGG